VRHAAGPGVREVQSATVSDREVCPECANPTGLSAVTPAGQRFDSPGSYTPKHLAEKIVARMAVADQDNKP
jgi:hypothetical protein